MSNAIKYMLLFIVVSFSALSQELEDEKMNYLLDLSLERLLSTNVNLGTKSNLALHKAPGIISLFTAKQIKQYGFRTLQEIISTLPSFQLNPYRQGHAGIFVRGVQGRNTDKILLLIDGIPYRDVYWGNFLIDEMIPIKNVESVEILNGPGSVLYGANAFAGIISVITKKSGTMISGQVGNISAYDFNITNNTLDANRSHDSQFYQASASYSSESFHAFAEVFNSDGFSPKRNADGALNKRPHDEKSRHLQMKYFTEHWLLIGNYTDNTTSYVGSVASDIRFFERKPFALTAQYNAHVNDHSSISASVFYNKYDLIREDKRYEKDDLPQRRLLLRHRDAHRTGYLTGFDGHYNFTLSQSHSITAGLSFFRDKPTDTFQYDINFDDTGAVEEVTKTELLLENVARNEKSFFIQDLWQINEDHILTSGIRFSNSSDFDNEINWRLGYTGQLDPYYVKLLAGTAYRLPTPREYLKDFGQGNPQPVNLAPESLLTIEAQLGYKYSKGYLTMTLFRNSYSDFIKEVDVDSIENFKIDDQYAFNFDEIKILGLELTATYHHADVWSVIVNASKLFKAEETAGDLGDGVVLFTPIAPGTKDIDFISDVTLSMVTHYKFSDRWHSNLTLIYNSNRDPPAFYQTDVEIQRPENADGFIIGNIGIDYSVTNNTSISFFIKNIADKRLYGMPVDGPDGYDTEYGGRMIGFEGSVSY